MTKPFVTEAFEDSSYTDIFARAWRQGNHDRHTTETAHSGTGSLRVDIPEGNHSGIAATVDPVDGGQLDSEAQEMYVSYWVKFAEDFESDDNGGKLPGLTNTEPGGGKGGDVSNGTNGWSARGKFDAKGNDMGVGFYCYHMDMSGGWGDHFDAATISRGSWHRIEEYIKLNSVSGGSANDDGVLKMWVDGDEAWSDSSMRFTEDPDRGVNFYMDVYYGGSQTSPADNTLWFDDLVLADGLPENRGKYASLPAKKPDGDVFVLKSQTGMATTEYEFTTDGPVAKKYVSGSDDGAESNDTITDNGDGTYTVSGKSGKGYTDAYYIDGSVTSMTLDPGQWTFTWKGNDVTPDGLGASVTNPNAGGSSSGEHSYSFSGDPEVIDQQHHGDSLVIHEDNFKVTNSYFDRTDVSDRSIFPAVTDPDGVGVIDGCLLDGGGIYVHPKYHQGTLIVKNCHVRRAADNGIYADETSGAIQDREQHGGRVILGNNYFVNNNISHIRLNLGGYVQNTVIENTNDVPGNHNGVVNSRGLHTFYGAGDFDMPEPTVRNCHIDVRSGNTNGAAGSFVVSTEGKHDTNPVWHVSDSELSGDIYDQDRFDGTNVGSDPQTEPPEGVPMSEDEALNGSKNGSPDLPNKGLGGSGGSGGSDGGSTPSPDPEPSGTLFELESREDPGTETYTFTVEGSVTKKLTGRPKAEKGNDSVSTDGSTTTVEGAAGNGYSDAFYVDGTITDLSVPDGWTLYWGDQKVAADSLLPDDGDGNDGEGDGDGSGDLTDAKKADYVQWLGAYASMVGHVDSISVTFSDGTTQKTSTPSPEDAVENATSSGDDGDNSSKDTSFTGLLSRLTGDK